MGKENSCGSNAVGGTERKRSTSLSSTNSDLNRITFDYVAISIFNILLIARNLPCKVNGLLFCLFMSHYKTADLGQWHKPCKIKNNTMLKSIVGSFCFIH